jgi:para-nitrobenzyl esterase
MLGRRSLLGASLAGLSAGKAAAASEVIAETSYGKVRGAVIERISTFKGIPYGGTTAGDGRFRPPAPPQPWAGVRDALEFAPMCPQVVRSLPSIFASWTFDKEMSEDCLALNVWTPAVGRHDKRPVMVWFHGGDFSSLSGSRNVFDGARLCHRGDVVVVTVNHRLNVFGYLYLGELVPDFADSGNVGMLDLVAALQWVRDNIEEFGGDPANVTIFGQSGGGAKVSTIMAMPAAEDLFHRAIVQSGSYYLSAMNREHGTRQAEVLLRVLDIKSSDAATLATLPVERLVQGLEATSKTPEKPNYRPVVDARVLPGGPWAPAAPALSTRVPLMVGTVATEMTLLIGAADPAAFALDDAGLRQRLGKWFASGDIETVIATFRKAEPSATPSDLFFAIATDVQMRQGAWLQAERKSAQHAAPVYLYELDWRTPVEGGKWKTPHSLDLAFVFDNVAKSSAMVGGGPEPQLVADQMSAAWIAFARTGNPNTPALPHWPPYEMKDRATMVFDTKSTLVKDFREGERSVLAGIEISGTF